MENTTEIVDIYNNTTTFATTTITNSDDNLTGPHFTTTTTIHLVYSPAQTPPSKVLSTLLFPNNWSSEVGPYSPEYYLNMTTEEFRNYIFEHQLPGQPSSVAAVAIIGLSGLVFLCSSLVLLATR